MISEFFKKYGWIYAIGIVFLFLNSYIDTFAPIALGNAVDALSGTVIVRKAVISNALLITYIALASFVARFLWRLLVIGNARNIECYLRRKLYEKLQLLPPSFFTGQRSGDLMAYAINDVGAVRKVFGPTIARTFGGTTTAVISIYSMIRIFGLRMTSLALAPLPLVILFVVLVGKVVRKRFTVVQGMFSNISGFINESIMGAKVIKTFANESERLDEYTELSDDMQNANIRLTYASSLITPSVTAAFGLCYASAVIMGGQAVINGSLSVGKLVAFLGYLLLIQNPVEQLGGVISDLQCAVASYKRLSRIYNAPQIPDFERSEYTGEITGSIEFKNLKYRYDGSSRSALDGFSLSINPGEKIGIAGEIGSGKTTVLKLLMKLYNPPAGTVFINGTDITKIPSRAIRNAVGFVPQDVFLFSASVTDNIAFCDESPDTERVAEAARLACVHEDILAFENGYDTQIGERGTFISGGQKQRISLARALYKDPDIVILDDTLSAVDSITEKKMTENIYSVLGGKTAVIVSCRLSVLEKCDRVIFMSEGKITEQGTHSELIQLGGAYARIYEKQIKGGESE